VLLNIISAPQSSSISGVKALTEACVPTGINTGVLMTPCAVCSFPRLACDDVLVFVISNLNSEGVILGMVRGSVENINYRLLFSCHLYHKCLIFLGWIR
jgi:hypothetical protein